MHGTGPDRGRHLPYANEPVAEPLPLKGREVLPFLGGLLDVMQARCTFTCCVLRIVAMCTVQRRLAGKFVAGGTGLQRSCALVRSQASNCAHMCCSTARRCLQR